MACKISGTSTSSGVKSRTTLRLCVAEEPKQARHVHSPVNAAEAGVIRLEDVLTWALKIIKLI